MFHSGEINLELKRINGGSRDTVGEGETVMPLEKVKQRCCWRMRHDAGGAMPLDKSGDGCLWRGEAMLCREEERRREAFGEGRRRNVVTARCREEEGGTISLKSQHGFDYPWRE